MRISPNEIDFLVNAITSCRPESKIYLFGSRADDQKKGGDIDILILADKKLELEERGKIYWAFCEKFGEQKLDLVCFKPEEEVPFKKLALLNAIALN